jgi:hypothetical protein
MMSRMRYTTIALLGAVLVATGVLSISLFQQLRRSELVDRPVYSTLKTIEFEHRGAPLRSPLWLIGAMDAGDVIGLPTDDPQHPNAWIATDRTPQRGVYVFPSTVRLRVTCSEIDKLVSGTLALRKIAPGVRSYLDGHCTR